MGSAIRSLSGAIIVVALLAAGRVARAEPDVDPSGHWDGAVQVPGNSVTIEIDLANNAKGQLAGTIGNPAMGEKGLPLATVRVAGREVTFGVKATKGGGTFRGVLDGDGKSMTGEFTTSDGAHAVPFQLTRTGEPRIAPPPKSPRIPKQLEGSWSGTLTVEGKQVRLVLTMTNHRDGTATGTITTGEGLQIPVAMTHKAAQLRIDVPSVGGAYTGVLNAARTELTGTWAQRSVTLPLTFRRDAN